MSLLKNTNSSQLHDSHQLHLDEITRLSIIFSAIIGFLFLIMVYYWIKMARINIHDILVDVEKPDTKPKLVLKYIENNVYNNINCSICIDSGNLKILECGHSFHELCIENWVETCYKENNPMECPICRSELKFE
jgi:hypothetical protein